MTNGKWKGMHSGGSGAIYGLGFVGALVYYVGNATTLTDGIIGFVKAILWPAFMVFRVLEFLKT